MNPIVKTNFYIITGGPGAGKTSVLKELKEFGFETVPEVARKIIQNQLAIGGDATHTGDRIAFRDLMLKYSLEDFKKLMDINKIIFFDRGIPDLLSYSTLISEPVTDTIFDAIKCYRYNTNVFLFPPWEEIYEHDAERKQDLEEAIITYQCIKHAYTQAGYKVCEVPKTDVSSRAKFILSYISNITDD